MQKIAILLLSLLVSLSVNAQIAGDKNITSETFPLENIKSIEINLTSDIVIDRSGKNEITITTDENLIPLIAKEMKGGKLNLNQKEWIRSSDRIKITIGAPNLKEIICDAHSNILVKEINAAEFEALVNVGTVTLQGKVQELKLQNKVGQIDASELEAENAEIRITSWGDVRARVNNRLTTFLSGDGKLDLVNTPKELSGDANNRSSKNEESTANKEDIHFINLELKNNSWNRKQYVVVGPKPNGRSFSYGFPMNPGQVRKKYWTNGTKVYETNWWGIRKLILTIEADDEGQLVKIYE